MCPEAADGGPIALVRDGDKISVNLSKGEIFLEVSDEELKQRKSEWKPVERAKEKGLLRRYAQTVSTARKGATLK